jgi:hypothetical protein
VIIKPELEREKEIIPGYKKVTASKILVGKWEILPMQPK